MFSLEIAYSAYYAITRRRLCPGKAMHLNLTYFETVCCIARLGTYSAAAAHLNTSQPAITSRVRELEETLGLTLFQRRGRRMELTIEGRHFIDEMEPLVAQLNQALFRFRKLSTAQGTVRIGGGDVTMSWLPDVLDRLQGEMPGVRYELENDMAPALMSKLLAGTLDLAVVAGEIQDARLHRVPLAPVQLVWLMSHRVAAAHTAGALSLAQLLDSAPLWLSSRKSDFFERAAATVRAHGGGLRNVSTCGSMVNMLDLIERTGGIGLVAGRIAAPRLAQGKVVPVPGMPEDAYRNTLVCHIDQQQSVIRHVMRSIVDFDRDSARAADVGAPRR